jgi:hypothetical protein
MLAYPLKAFWDFGIQFCENRQPTSTVRTHSREAPLNGAAKGQGGLPSVSSVQQPGK